VNIFHVNLVEPLALPHGTESLGRFHQHFTSRFYGANFINILRVHYSYKSALRSFFLLTCNLRKAAKKTFVQKGVHKMLMKLTHARGSKKCKKTLITWLSLALWSACACKLIPLCDTVPCWESLIYCSVSEPPVSVLAQWLADHFTGT